MTEKIYCNKCKKELMAGQIFTIIVEQFRVNDTHLCSSCYQLFCDWLELEKE